MQGKAKLSDRIADGLSSVYAGTEHRREKSQMKSFLFNVALYMHTPTHAQLHTHTHGAYLLPPIITHLTSSKSTGKAA